MRRITSLRAVVTTKHDDPFHCQLCGYLFFGDPFNSSSYGRGMLRVIQVEFLRANQSLKSTEIYTCGAINAFLEMKNAVD